MAEDWIGALKECDTVDKFNAFALSLARDRKAMNPNDGFAVAVAGEAKRRAYTYVGDRSTGYYTDLTKEEYAMVLAELNRIERQRGISNYMGCARQTRVKMVSAMWQQADVKNQSGRVFILDLRKRPGNKYIYFYSDVPLNLFNQLFSPSAKLALKDIQSLCEEVVYTPTGNLLEAG